MSTVLKTKLNARGRHQLEEGMFNSSIEVLIRTDKQPSPQQHKELQSAGYRTRVVVGNVLSGAVTDAQDLEQVAELPFVRKIELSSPMFQES